MKWSGLGMGIFSTTDTSIFDGWVDTLLANGFTNLRVDIPLSLAGNAAVVARSKAAVIRAIARGANVTWGVCSGWSGDLITAANWAARRQSILDAATWAQANGVYEFQLGNEEESHCDGTTMTVSQMIDAIKSVATDAQAIYTRGNISYSCETWSITEWAFGKGDIDLLCANVYKTMAAGWEVLVNQLVSAFGVNGTYLTEFSLDATNLATFSADETNQYAAISNMISYIRASGMTRANYFCYYDENAAYGGPDGFGALKTDQTFRKLWYALLGTRPASGDRGATNARGASVARGATAVRASI